MRVLSIFPQLSATLWAVIAFIVLLFSLSNDSIDMDEAQTWDYARLVTFSSFCNELQTDQNSEAQMPVGMFAYWAWAKICGTGETGMRSLNLVWAAMVLFSLAHVGRQLRLPWLPFLFAVQPFVWYCMNQARTPVMQMAGGALLLAGAVCYLRCRVLTGWSIAYICLGSVILVGGSMLGLVPLAAVIAIFLAYGVWRKLHLPSRARFPFYVTLGILGLLGAYFALTLMRGAGGAKLWMVSPLNLLFVSYEFLGFQGLGPGRQELRAIMKGLAPSREILSFIPGYMLLALAYAGTIFSAYKSWLTRESSSPRQSNNHSKHLNGRDVQSARNCAWLMSVGVVLLSGAMLFVAAATVGFPFWGRHLAGSFPFWILALAMILAWSTQGLWRKRGRAGCVAVIGLLSISSLLIRFAPLHGHDDYRGAAKAAAIWRQSHSVWWVADYSGGAYYGLSFVKAHDPIKGEIVHGPNRDKRPSTFPDVIIISRPDNFDRHGIATQMIREGHYVLDRQLQEFAIWVRVQGN